MNQIASQPASQTALGNRWVQPRRAERWLLISIKLLSVFLLLLFLIVPVVYGIRVHYEDAFGRLVKKTQNIEERNALLQMRLSQMQSYKRIESSATQLTYLQDPKSTIYVPTDSHHSSTLVKMPVLKQGFPRVYGY
jgi:hypothetical protein